MQFVRVAAVSCDEEKNVTRKDMKTSFLLVSKGFERHMQVELLEISDFLTYVTVLLKYFCVKCLKELKQTQRNV